MKAKIVFITGASSGIGEGCARKFAKEGWNLILNARTVSKLEELKAELEKEYGIQVCVLPFDVRDRKQAAKNNTVHQIHLSMLLQIRLPYLRMSTHLQEQVL